MGKVRVVNIERGMPTAEEAKRRLTDEMMRAKRDGITALKVIHGYGSSGVGGKLRIEIRKFLSFKKGEGRIKNYISGEQWSVFDSGARDILNKYPELKNDPDLENFNEGITIVLM